MSKLCGLDDVKLAAAAAAAAASLLQHCDKILLVLRVHETNFYGQGPSQFSMKDHSIIQVIYDSYTNGLLYLLTLTYNSSLLVLVYHFWPLGGIIIIYYIR